LSARFRASSGEPRWQPRTRSGGCAAEVFGSGTSWAAVISGATHEGESDRRPPPFEWAASSHSSSLPRHEPTGGKGSASALITKRGDASSETREFRSACRGFWPTALARKHGSGPWHVVLWGVQVRPGSRCIGPISEGPLRIFLALSQFLSDGYFPTAPYGSDAPGECKG